MLPLKRNSLKPKEVLFHTGWNFNPFSSSLADIYTSTALREQRAQKLEMDLIPAGVVFCFEGGKQHQVGEDRDTDFSGYKNKFVVAILLYLVKEKWLCKSLLSKLDATSTSVKSEASHSIGKVQVLLNPSERTTEAGSVFFQK